MDEIDIHAKLAQIETAPHFSEIFDGDTERAEMIAEHLIWLHTIRRERPLVSKPCDARTLSKERVQKRSPRLLRISETTAERGEYLLGGVFTRPCDKNGTQGVCVAQRAVFCALRSRSRARSFASVVLAKRTMQQCKGLPWEPCRAAFSIPFHRTPLQCCNLHPR